MTLMVHAVSLTGQSKSELREMFVSAEGDLLFEDYAEALPKYLSLLQIYPENYNLYYRIGQCYLNTPGEKGKAIPFLETAVQNINPSYRKGKMKETGAPYEALYFLANAYRIAGDFDGAIRTYDIFLQDVDTEVYDTALVRFQIETCHNARKKMSRPVSRVEMNLGAPVNSRFSEYSPVVSSDEKSLLFTRELQFYDAVFWSRKVGGEWTEPVNLTPQLGVDQDYYTSSLSPDGQTLLLYRIDTYDGNIYISRLEGDTWSRVEKLNDNINTKFWESHATMSHDGRRIFFTSNRRESLGGLDIFVSERDSTGSWGPAMNLGPVINTVYNEETPFLANDDRTLFFSSRGHDNMGGYDIFRSDLDENGRWGTPVNIGYPANTTDDDLFFCPLGKGYRGYYSRFSDEGYGRMDIFSCDIYSDFNPRRLIVAGRAIISNLLDEFAQPVKISAVSKTDPSYVTSTLTDPPTGFFRFQIQHGSYNITFASDGALTHSVDIEIPPEYPADTLFVEPVLLEEADHSAFLRVLSDTVLNISAPGPAAIDLIAEAKAILDIVVLSPDSAIYSERHRLNDPAFTFSFEPVKGDSRVILKLTDRFGNDTTAAVRVSRKDASVGRMRQLYREEAGTPSGENASVTPAGEKEDADLPEIVTAADTALQSGDVIGSETAAPGERADKMASWPWWLMAATVVLLLIVLWYRRKRKQNDKDL